MKRGAFRYQITALVILGGILPLCLVGFIRNLEDEQLKAEFDVSVKKRSELLNEAVRVCLQEMQSVGAFFAASEEVNRGEFERFGQQILQHPNSLQALEWIPRVKNEWRASFEAARSDLRAGPFALTELDPEGGDDLVEAGVREEYFPVDFIVPWEGNEKAFGYDLGSNPARMAALQNAMDTGEMSATEPVQLVQEQGESFGFLVVRPVYIDAVTPETVRERRAALDGFILGLFRVDELVGNALADVASEDIHLRLRHANSPEIVSWMPGAPDRGSGSGSVLSSSVPVQIVDQPWSAEFSRRTGFGDYWRTLATILLAVAGMILALLLGLLIRKSRQQADRVEQARDDLALALEQKDAALEEARLLDRITEQIEIGTSLSEILEDIYESFQSIMPYHRIGFAMIEGEPKVVRLVWGKPIGEESTMRVDYTSALRGSSLEDVIRTGTPRIINDLEEYYRAKPDSESTRLILKEEMRSSLTCPLVAMGEPVGFLFFSHREPNTYSEEHGQVFMRIANHVSRVVEKAILFDSVEREQRQSEKLLTSILPKPIVRRLKAGHGYLADQVPEATIAFADIVGFTDWGATCRPEFLVEQLGNIFELFDEIARACNVQKICTHGDLYLAAGGLPSPSAEHAHNIAKFALGIREAIGKFSRNGDEKMRLRIGIHSGPVIAGVAGKWAFRYDIWGSTVNLASRLEESSEPGRIQVSEATYHRVSDAYSLERRGVIDLKSFGETTTYWLNGPEGTPPPTWGEGEAPVPLTMAAAGVDSGQNIAKESSNLSMSD